MLGITHFGFFVFAVFLLNITPGPDTAYIVGRSVAQGRRTRQGPFCCGADFHRHVDVLE